MQRVSGSERIAHLRHARDLMDRCYADPLDLDQMAAQAGFSKFHFARAFKETYGESPANYLTCRRLERAKDLLRSANLTVTEVCMLVGFSSLGSFSSPILRAGRHVAERLPAAPRPSGAVRPRSRAASSWTGAGPGRPSAPPGATAQERKIGEA